MRAAFRFQNTKEYCPLVESKCRWNDDIKMDLQEVGRVWRWLDSCGSGYEQVAGSCEYGE